VQNTTIRRTIGWTPQYNSPSSGPLNTTKRGITLSYRNAFVGSGGSVIGGGGGGGYVTPVGVPVGTPEPATVALVFAGLGGIFYYKRRFKA
jgi:hypothetical protein